MTVVKLIENYKRKVNSIDDDLALIVKSIQSERKQGFETYMLAQERIGKEALKQAYFQMIKDLEDL